MKIVKIVLGVLAAFVVLVVVSIAAVFFFTGGIVETADTFFKEVAAGNMDGAWNHLSADFKESTPRPEFEAFLRDSSLVDYESASWTNRSITASSGSLEGTVTTSDGTIPIKITFVKDAGEWKIQFIEKEASGIASEVEVPIPSLEESAELVKTTTSDFAAAVNNNDFTEFHATVAQEFQEQLSPEKFAEVFATFIDQEIDLSVLEDMEPAFTSDPGLSADKTLLLEGYFPSTPMRTYFSYTYVKRPAGWKLLGLDVNIKPIKE